MVGQPTGHEGARSAAEQQARDIEPRPHGVRVERRLKSLDGPVDDAAVVAKEESPDGCHQRDENDERKIRRTFFGHRGLSSPKDAFALPREDIAGQATQVRGSLVMPPTAAQAWNLC